MTSVVVSRSGRLVSVRGPRCRMFVLLSRFDERGSPPIRVVAVVGLLVGGLGVNDSPSWVEAVRESLTLAVVVVSSIVFVRQADIIEPSIVEWTTVSIRSLVVFWSAIRPDVGRHCRNNA